MSTKQELPGGSQRTILVLYTNHAGKQSLRRVQLLRMFWGITAWHKKPQWFFEVYDLDRKDKRFFALADCNFTAMPQPHLSPDAIQVSLRNPEPDLCSCGNVIEDPMASECPACLRERVERNNHDKLFHELRQNLERASTSHHTKEAVINLLRFMWDRIKEREVKR